MHSNLHLNFDKRS